MLGDKKEVKNSLVFAIAHPKQALQEALKLVNLGAVADETFFRQTYRWLVDQLRPGTTLIDIGANVGDTAIYFAQFREVNRVIAYEPAPRSYRLMRENVRRSGLAGKITLRNAAMSGSNGHVRIADNTDSLYFNIDRHTAGKGRNVKVVTLGNAVEGLKNVAVKCDCEGGEARIFDTDLVDVYAIMVEWHGPEARGSVFKALDGRGFRVSSETTNRRDRVYGSVGYIRARRGGKQANP